MVGITTASNTALGGLISSTERLNESANRIASGQSVSEGRIVEDIVDIKLAEQSFRANALIIDVVDELQGELLNAISSGKQQ